MIEHGHLVFAPILPPEILWLLACVATALAALAIFRRAPAGWLRAALMAMLLLACANPSLITEKREPLKDTALVVIDESASMQLGDRGKQAERAAAAVSTKLATFTDLDVETLRIKGEDETDLFHAIEQKQSQLPANRLAGIIAITDGEIHDTPMADLQAPFHALIAGQKRETDRRLTIVSAPAYGIVNQPVTVTVRVEDTPDTQSPNAAVTMTSDGGETQTVTVPVGKDTKIETRISHAGPNTLAFTTETLPNELTSANNTAVTSINGIRDRMRVLLVSGQPHSGGRNWRNLLKADPAIDLVHFTILRSPFKDNAIPNNQLSLIAFPSQEIFDTKLKNFDLVIFDGFGTRFLIPDRYLTNIARYVEQGGALLVTNATGAQAAELSQSPLARILPTSTKGEVLTGAFVPDLTEAGKRHPVTASLIKSMPRSQWAPWYRMVNAQSSNSENEILLAGQNQKPLLVLSRVGEGRVAQFLSNQFWLWTKQYPSGGPENELLRRTAHWLTGEPELDETALRARAEPTENGWQLTITKQSLQNKTENAIMTGPDQQPVQVKLTPDEASGTLQATVPVREKGLYRIKDDKHEILVMTGHPESPEYGAMHATEEKVKPVTKASSGSITWLADTPDAPEIRRTDKNASQNGWGWIGLKKNGQYRITGSTVTPLLPAWSMLTILLLLAVACWRREGR